MYQVKKFYRGEAHGTERRTLPATTYNNLKRLLQLSDSPKVLIPVKKMQYLAVADQNEIVFVDIHFRSVVEFAWHSFETYSRKGIASPVDFQFCWYNIVAQETMQRMPDEFNKAIEVKLERVRKEEPASCGNLLRFPTNSDL